MAKMEVVSPIEEKREERMFVLKAEWIIPYKEAILLHVFKGRALPEDTIFSEKDITKVIEEFKILTFKPETFIKGKEIFEICPGDEIADIVFQSLNYQIGENIRHYLERDRANFEIGRLKGILLYYENMSFFEKLKWLFKRNKK